MKIIFLEANSTGTAYSAMLKAKELGYTVVLATCEKEFYKKLALNPLEIADIIIDVDSYNVEAVTSELKKLDDVKAIIAFDDYRLLPAAKVAENLNLPHCPIMALEKSRFKQKTREALKSIPTTPRFSIIDKNSDINDSPIGYPCIVKPIDDSGSVNVMRCNNQQEFVQAINAIRSHEINTRGYKLSGQALIEEFIEGEEFSAELMWDNEKNCWVILGYTTKDLSSLPYFVELGHMFPYHFENADLENEIQKAIHLWVNTIGLSHTVLHLEFKITPKNEVKLIEINPRPAGGLITELCKITTGFDVVAHYVKLHLGIKSGVKKSVTEYPKAYIRFFTSECGGEIVTITNNNKDITPYFGPKFASLPCNVEGRCSNYDYLGHAIFVGNSMEEVVAKADQYEANLSLEIIKPFSVTPINLRSDTFSKPSSEMLQAMLNANVGDDAYGEDPSTNELQKYCAQLFGKESSLFFPSTTMVNQAALKVLLNPGDEVILDSSYHINFFESAQSSALQGAVLNPVTTVDGILRVDNVKELIDSKSRINPAYAQAKLIVIENTISSHGGKIFPLNELQALREFADQHNIKIFMDGSRLLNACAALNIDPKEYTKYVDALSVCFSKGLSCPGGGILIGCQNDITKAKTFRKWFGGALHQSGYLTAPALMSLTDLSQLQTDNNHAALLYQLLNSAGIPLEKPDTNMLLINTETLGIDSLTFAEKLKQRGVLVFPWQEKFLRIVMYRSINENDVKNSANIIIALWGELKHEKINTTSHISVNKIDESKKTIIVIGEERLSTLWNKILDDTNYNYIFICLPLLYKSLIHTKITHPFNVIGQVENFYEETLAKFILNHFHQLRFSDIQFVTTNELFLLTCIKLNNLLRNSFTQTKLLDHGHNNLTSELISANLLMKNHIFQPKPHGFDTLLNTLFEKNISFPITIKKLNANDATPIKKFDTPEKLSAFVAAMKKTDDLFEITEFVEGDNYHCFAIIHHGQITLSIVGKYSSSKLDFLSGEPIGMFPLIESDVMYSPLINFMENIIKHLPSLSKFTIHLDILNHHGKLKLIDVAFDKNDHLINQMLKIMYDINMQAKLPMDLAEDASLKRNIFTAWIIFPKVSGIVSSIIGDNYFQNFQSSCDCSWNISVGNELKNSFTTEEFANLILLTNNNLEELRMEFKKLIETKLYTTTKLAPLVAKERTVRENSLDIKDNCDSELLVDIQNSFSK